MARRRLAELRRKFGEAEAPRGIVGGRIGSPVPEAKVGRLTDEQWLRAIGRYAHDEIRHDRPAEQGGGVHELAQQLHGATREDPLRFAHLGLRLPVDVHPAYPEAILRGLIDGGPVDPELVFDFARWCHAFPGRPCGRYVADAIAAHAEAGRVPPDIVGLVSWYATQDPDEGGVGSRADRDLGPRLGLIEAGINTNRGRAAGAIARLLEDGAPLEPWRSTVLRLMADPSEAVRACAAQTLLAALRLDRDWAATALVQLLGGSDEVATSAYAERLLWLLSLTHPQLTTPTIEGLVASGEPDVARVGGRLAALSALSSPAQAHLANGSLRASSGARLGVAEIYSANLGDESVRAACREGLIGLFADEDAKVRREAATAFQHLHGQALAGEQVLVAAFTESPALIEHPHDLLDAFLDSPVVLPDLAVRACLRVVEAAGIEAGSIASGWSAQMPDVAAIAVRVYAYGTPVARPAPSTSSIASRR